MLLIEFGNRAKMNQNTAESFSGSSHRDRDAVWKPRTCQEQQLPQREVLCFTDNLTKKDRENRHKLWPMNKGVRKEGKSTYFLGGFINGLEIHQWAFFMEDTLDAS